MTLIISNRSGCFVMHHQFHAFRVGIIVECLDVEIRIGSLEIKHIVLLMTKPIFPSDIPSLNKHLRKPVFGGKVDIFSHIFIICRMIAMGFAFGIIGRADMHRR